MVNQKKHELSQHYKVIFNLTKSTLVYFLIFVVDNARHYVRCSSTYVSGTPGNLLLVP
jgi:hypothetical protein